MAGRLQSTKENAEISSTFVLASESIHKLVWWTVQIGVVFSLWFWLLARFRWRHSSDLIILFVYVRVWYALALAALAMVNGLIFLGLISARISVNFVLLSMLYPFRWLTQCRGQRWSGYPHSLTGSELERHLCAAKKVNCSDCRFEVDIAAHCIHSMEGCSPKQW